MHGQVDADVQDQKSYARVMRITAPAPASSSSSSTGAVGQPDLQTSQQWSSATATEDEDEDGGWMKVEGTKSASYILSDCPSSGGESGV